MTTASLIFLGLNSQSQRGRRAFQEMPRRGKSGHDGIMAEHPGKRNALQTWAVNYLRFKKGFVMISVIINHVLNGTAHELENTTRYS